MLLDKDDNTVVLKYTMPGGKQQRGVNPMIPDKVKTMTTRNDKRQNRTTRNDNSQKGIETEHRRSQGEQRVVAVSSSGGRYY